MSICSGCDEDVEMEEILILPGGMTKFADEVPYTDAVSDIVAADRCPNCGARHFPNDHD